MVLGKGRPGTFKMCIRLHINVLSHTNPNKRHSHPSSTSQTLHHLPHVTPPRRPHPISNPRSKRLDMASPRAMGRCARALQLSRRPCLLP
jgi:hypothetical protein